MRVCVRNVNEFYKTLITSTCNLNNEIEINQIKPNNDIELTAQDLNEINTVISAIGKYDSSTQSEIIDRSLSRLENILHIAEKEAEKNSKLYTFVFLTVGLLISLMLL